MNKKQSFFILVSSLGIIGCWAIVAFLIKEELIQRFSFWSSLIIGTATTIISVVALGISVLTYRSHELEKIKAKEENAKLFLHDNNDEIDYLPCCVYASCFDRHGHHTRKIYNEFCRLSDEMQKEVLKHANYKITTIDNADWTSEKIGIINNFAKEYGFGDTLLYDSGKLFIDGYRNKKEPYVEERVEELPDMFGMYGLDNRLLNRRRITIDEYFKSYAYRKFRDPKWLERYKYEPPCDVLINIKKLKDTEKASDAMVAYWLCHEIEDIYYVIEEYFYGKRPEKIIVNDAQPMFFEDKFYMVLNILHCLDDYSKYKIIHKEPFDKKERDEIENTNN